MHIAASNPLAIKKESISKKIVDKELEIIKAEANSDSLHKWLKKYLKVKFQSF